MFTILATIEILLGITIVDKPDPVAVSKDATDPLSEFDTMSKEDLIEKLLAERVCDLLTMSFIIAPSCLLMVETYCRTPGQQRA